MEIVAIIPARGGSKGVPYENIRLLADKPLIVYSILDAQEANLLECIYVTTADSEIAQVSMKIY